MLDFTSQSFGQEGFYWVRARPRRSWAFCWRGVGRAVSVKVCWGSRAVTRVFRVRVARSASRVRKLCTGRPSSVRPVVCLVMALAERSALATTLARNASAASFSVSSYSMGGQALAHVPFQVICEHAQKHVGAHAVGQPVVDWPDLEVDASQVERLRLTMLKQLIRRELRQLTETDQRDLSALPVLHRRCQTA